MLKVKFYDTVDDELLKFAVIISQSNGKWVLCKHKERDTYEVPGGHREVGEDILETAERELQEETGAVKFDIKPLCVYSVTGKNSVNEEGEESFGLLCFAEIEEFSDKLESEIERVELMDELPENWTYPLIQPKLIEEWKRRQPWGDIAKSKEWKKIHKIAKGWSTDLKYKIYTKKGEVDGYHLVVHVWIRNSKGEYLISQRSANRPTYPLMWECVGGSVVKGEDSLQGAIREAKEEVGVDLNAENGQVLFTKTRKIIDGKIYNDIMDVWLFEYDGEVNLGNATTDEVAQVTWMNREQIKELFEHNMFVETLEYFFAEVDKKERKC